MIDPGMVLLHSAKAANSWSSIPKLLLKRFMWYNPENIAGNKAIVNTPGQCFPTQSHLVPQRTTCNVWRYLTVTTGGNAKGCRPGVMLNIQQSHRTAPKAKDCLAQNGHHTDAEKPDLSQHLTQK
jgi:hypothetical protein